VGNTFGDENLNAIACSAQWLALPARFGITRR
jgi:hypothetical protein